MHSSTLLAQDFPSQDTLTHSNAQDFPKLSYVKSAVVVDIRQKLN